MTEYGIFNAEGLLEGQFFSRESAIDVLIQYTHDDDAWVSEVCVEHTDQPHDECEECDLEEEEQD